jgi:uncharacterized protein
VQFDPVAAARTAARLQHPDEVIRNVAIGRHRGEDVVAAEDEQLAVRDGPDRRVARRAGEQRGFAEQRAAVQRREPALRAAPFVDHLELAAADEETLRTGLALPDHRFARADTALADVPGDARQRFGRELGEERGALDEASDRHALRGRFEPRAHLGFARDRGGEAFAADPHEHDRDQRHDGGGAAARRIEHRELAEQLARADDRDRNRAAWSVDTDFEPAVEHDECILAGLALGNDGCVGAMGFDRRRVRQRGERLGSKIAQLPHVRERGGGLDHPAAFACRHAESRTVQIGKLRAIHRYPVKALRGETLATADVFADGIAGDRTAALVVVSEGHSRTGKTYRGKENARLHTLATADGGVEAAAGAGLVAVRVDDAGRYFDLHPISLIFDAWVGALEALTGAPVETLRFRPNLVATGAPGFAQSAADLIGSTLRIGGAVLTVVSAIVRCVTPSYDLVTGERDRDLARALAVDLGNVMGVYCTVTQPGRVATGDAIARD